MQSRIPEWTIEAPQSPVPREVVKVGGLPLGWPSGREWPLCAECGMPMSFLLQAGESAQLPHLSADQVMFVFKCERYSICSFWEPGTGRNCVELVGFDELSDTAAPAPAGTPVLLELWARRWRVHDDGVDASLEPAFFDARHDAMPEGIAYPHDFNFALQTKVGGLPYWTANGTVAFRYSGGTVLTEGGDWHLVLQLDTALEVVDPIDAVQAYADSHPIGPAREGAAEVYPEDGSVGIANFCLDGIGYVLVDSSSPSPEPVFLINR
ncbi:hypothetical protein [Actinomyces ruminis]|uniref:DUF1963 domain-containing protein n=1 Tax=Actinomyces ruminis TaxID=1937003 RepID=A0ABX4M966_9ACTO|nr:hypothetical protein [Actinomyces ruminis]PHP51998.1 hypothetical protein BW737_012865 [Actinomyces ruminis]